MLERSLELPLYFLIWKSDLKYSMQMGHQGFWRNINMVRSFDIYTFEQISGLQEH